LYKHETKRILEQSRGKKYLDQSEREQLGMETITLCKDLLNIVKSNTMWHAE
jgi:hypothetical protein